MAKRTKGRKKYSRRPSGYEERLRTIRKRIGEHAEDSVLQQELERLRQVAQGHKHNLDGVVTKLSPQRMITDEED